MKKITVLNVGGCIERWLDADRIRDYLSKNRYIIVDKPEDAEIIILVTCAVFNEVADYTLDIIENFQKYDAELVVAGCLPDIEPLRLSKIFNGRILTTKGLDREIENLFPPLGNVRFGEVDDGSVLTAKDDKTNSFKLLENPLTNYLKIDKIYSKIRRYILRNLFGEKSASYKNFTERKNLYHLRICWGCAGNCSFCATKKAVGPLRSKPLDQCVKEFKGGLSKGYKNFVICSDDPGAYGLDIGSSFVKLLDEITKIKGDYKIDISGLSPGMTVKYVDQLGEIFRRGKIRSILIPVQSGSERILKLMRRYPNADKIKDAFLKLKNFYPELSLETQCIVGFPTETWEDFEKTLNFIKECNFYFGFFYVFSSRDGTDAAEIEPKVSKKEINKRLRYAKRFLGRAGYKLSPFKLGVSKNTYVFYLNK